MRRTLNKVGFSLVALIAANILLLSGVVAKADGGGSAFNSGDGRVNPLAGDRVAVYCNPDNLAVWGTDTSSNGVPLTIFTLSELVSTSPVTHSSTEGSVTLYQDRPAQTHVGYTTDSSTSTALLVDQGTQYHVIWAGGNYGADGSAAFSKTFSCTYLSQ